MKPRLRAIFLVLLLLVYGTALQRLNAFSAAPAAANPEALAQAYPGVTPSATTNPYPGPPATGAATPTDTATPTNASTSTPAAAATLTPTASGTPAVALPPASTRVAATDTPTPAPSSPLPQPSPTTIPTTQSRSQGATPLVSEQTPNGSLGPSPGGPAAASDEALGTPVAEAVVGSVEPGGQASRLAREAGAPVLPSLAPPAADLLPPVAIHPAGPGAPLTLVIGLVVAGLAYWAWQRWARGRG